MNHRRGRIGGRPDCNFGRSGVRPRQVGIRVIFRLLVLAVVAAMQAACTCETALTEAPDTTDAEAYYLPFEAGTKVWVAQGYNGILSHSGQYAVDFAVPIGTPVLAARRGTVIDFNADSDCNNWTILGQAFADPSCRWNFVRIQHSDGTVAVYGHLAHDSVFVVAGQQVARGERIALSGHTGFSATPHLHFAVSNPPTPAHFVDVCGDGEPLVGYEYTSQNPGPDAGSADRKSGTPDPP